MKYQAIERSSNKPTPVQKEVLYLDLQKMDENIVWLSTVQEMNAAKNLTNINLFQNIPYSLLL